MPQYRPNPSATPNVQNGYAPLDSGLHVPLANLSGLTTAQMASGQFPRGQLAYQALASAFTTASASLVDVTGLSLTVTATVRPLCLVFFCPGAGLTVAGNRMQVGFFDVTGSTLLGGSMVRSPTSFADSVSLYVCMRNFLPGAGSRTYKVQAASVDSGTLTLGNDFGSSYFAIIEE